MNQKNFQWHLDTGIDLSSVTSMMETIPSPVLIKSIPSLRAHHESSLFPSDDRKSNKRRNTGISYSDNTRNLPRVDGHQNLDISSLDRTGFYVQSIPPPRKAQTFLLGPKIVAPVQSTKILVNVNKKSSEIPGTFDSMIKSPKDHKSLEIINFHLKGEGPPSKPFKNPALANPLLQKRSYDLVNNHFNNKSEDDAQRPPIKANLNNNFRADRILERKIPTVFSEDKSLMRKFNTDIKRANDQKNSFLNLFESQSFQFPVKLAIVDGEIFSCASGSQSCYISQSQKSIVVTAINTSAVAYRKYELTLSDLSDRSIEIRQVHFKY